jgi:hypothetical protein
VDLSDDLPPPRRQLFFPVVIATVLLSVIGMSAGLVLGSQRERDQSSGQQQQQSQFPPADSGTSATPEPTEATEPSGPACRKETQVMASQFGANGTLRVALQLRTKSSAVWICVDEDGRYYYHANKGGSDGPWVERKTALFLADVRRDGDEYLATASDGTTFSVTSERLFIQHADGRPETQVAVD